jgi:PAS domain S-box-containing protein
MVTINERAVKRDEKPAKNKLILSSTPEVDGIFWEIDLLNRTANVTASAFYNKHLPAFEPGQNFIDWINSSLHKNDLKRVTTRFENFLEEKNDNDYEDVYRIFNPNTSSYFWMHTQYNIVRDASGQAILITGTSVDISKADEVEYELSKQKEQYQFLVQSLGKVVFALDKNGNFSSISTAWKDLLGYNSVESVGKPFLEYLSNDHLHLFWEEFGSLLSGKKENIECQMQLVSLEGDKVWVKILAKTTFDCKKAVDGVFGTIENIDDAYSAGLVLKETNDRINTKHQFDTTVFATYYHEFNTPLHGILGGLSLLLNARDSFSDIQVHELLTSILTSGLRLNHSLANLMLYEEMKRAEVYPEMVSMFTNGLSKANWVNKVQTELATLSEESYNRIDDLTIDLKPEEVRIDPEYLQRMILELVDNSFKFSTPGDKIYIKGYAKGEEYKIEVRDNGRGFELNSLDDIVAFKQFNRNKFEQQGLGIGLFLVKRLLELNHGDLRIVSTVGKGTNVTIQLPLPTWVDSEETLIGLQEI